MKRQLATLAALAVVLTACSGTATEESTTTTVADTTTTTQATTTTTRPRPTTTRPTPTTTTAPKPELTQEIAGAALQDVTARLFEAWKNRAGQDEYASLDKEIEGIVRQLLASHSKPAGNPPWLQELVGLSRGMDELPYDGLFPEGTFTKLAIVGVPGAPVTLYAGLYSIGEEWTTGSSGSHSGDETTIPGTYVVYDVEDCYWERLDDRGEIIDNNFIMAAHRVQATIRASDAAFNSECGRWVRVGG